MKDGPIGVRILWVLLVVLATGFHTTTPPVIAQGNGALGILGDSGVDEYRGDDWRGGSYAATTFNWVELLARFRGVNVGSWGSYAAPRRGGYAYNWARSGAVTCDVLSQGQASGLAGQISSGQVSWVVVNVGANDFSTYFGQYQDIYNGSLAGSALTSYNNNIVSCYAKIMDAVIGVGAHRIFVRNIADVGQSPSMFQQFPNAAQRQRVTDAIASVNEGLRQAAIARGVTVWDFATMNVRLAPRFTAEGHLLVGGETIRANAGDEPHHVFLGDNNHAGTVFNGLMANDLLPLMNAAGFGVDPFTDADILGAAGIGPAPPPPADTTAPSVSITNPANGAQIPTGSITVSAMASDAVGVQGVRFYANGTWLRDDTSAPYTATWVAVAGGATLLAEARDAAGNTATSTVVVSVAGDTTAPTVAITSPANGGQVTAGSITVSATASDAVGVQGVRFYANGTLLRDDTSPPYTATWSAVTGPATLLAQARDAAGNTATSTVAVTVVAPPPPPPPPVTVVPSAVQIVPGAGSLVSGTLSSLQSDNNLYYVVRSTTSGWTRTSQTDVTLSGVNGAPVRLEARARVKAASSGERLTMSVWNNTSQAWVQVWSTSSLSTSETAASGTISSSVAQYISGGVVRVLLQGTSTLSTHTTSIDQVTVTATY
jgi:hypothetical protein